MQTGRVSTPLTTLGSVIALVAIIIWFLIFRKFYNNYRETEKNQSLYFSMALLFGSFSLIFLALELLTFQIFDNGTSWGSTYIGRIVFADISSFDLGIIFGVIAVVLSSVSLFFFDVFSLSFFDNKMKWIFIPAILIFAYIILYLYYWPTVVLNEQGTDYDITRAGDIEALMIALFVGPIFMPGAVFLISAYQVRGNTFNVRRSITLCIFQVLLAIGYTVEITGGTGIESVLARLLIMIFPLGVFWTLHPTSFVKRLLGAPK